MDLIFPDFYFFKAEFVRMCCNILEIILTKLRQIVIFTSLKLVFSHSSSDPLCGSICRFTLISQLFEVGSENKLHHCTREQFCYHLDLNMTRFEQFWKFSLLAAILDLWEKIIEENFWKLLYFHEEPFLLPSLKILL